MATNNMNEVSTFQSMDTSPMEGSSTTLSQSGSQPHGPQQINNAETMSPLVETVTVVPPITTTISNANLHSVLTTSSTTNPSTSTAVSAASSNQNHTTPAASTHNPKGTQSSANSQATNTNHDQILTKTRLQDLVKEIDPCEQLDEEVEDLLLQLVDDFVTSTVNTACVFAKHRNSNTVEIKDVQLYLEKTYNMWIPGFGTEEVKPYKKPPMTEAHKQRLALIRKSLRKY